MSTFLAFSADTQTNFYFCNVVRKCTLCAATYTSSIRCSDRSKIERKQLNDRFNDGSVHVFFFIISFKVFSMTCLCMIANLSIYAFKIVFK